MFGQKQVEHWMVDRLMDRVEPRIESLIHSILTSSRGHQIVADVLAESLVEVIDPTTGSPFSEQILLKLIERLVQASPDFRRQVLSLLQENEPSPT